MLLWLKEMETKKLETGVQSFESLQKRVTYQNDSIWSIPGISKCSIFSLCAFMCCLQPTMIPPRPHCDDHRKPTIRLHLDGRTKAYVGESGCTKLEDMQYEFRRLM
ncbi:hypothetical protein L1887_36668 [Cichorium endivia]|nr:hypothetical protein L1887_36668 [Cichorium endivia]